MGVENLVPSQHPNKFGFVRCHVPKSARTWRWRSNVHSLKCLNNKLPMVGLIPIVFVLHEMPRGIPGARTRKKSTAKWFFHGQMVFSRPNV